MIVNFYLTDWLPGLGRYATIITAFQNDLLKNFISEAYIFTIDTGPAFYNGQRIIYSCANVEEYNNESKIHDHTLRYAENVIYLHNDEVSKKTNNRELLLKEWKHNKGGAFIVLGEIYRNHKDKMMEIAGNTESDELKKMIKSFLKVMGSNPIKIESL